MTSNTRYFCTIIVFFFVQHTLFAQTYTTAAGLRLGTEWGATLQQRIGKRLTLEGILQNSIRRDEFVITGLVERHHPILTKRFNIYVGGGLHKGWTTSTEANYDNPWGVTGILGGEFTIGRLNLSYDFKPSINISGGEKDFYMHSGVSVRYVFVKQKVFNDFMKNQKKKKKKRQKSKRKKNREPINWRFWENWDW